MTDRLAAAARLPSTATRWIRRGVMAVGSLVGVPLLLLFGYLLAWFIPEVVPDDEPPLPGMHPEPPGGAIAWGSLLVPSVAAATCLALGWIRLGRPGRWWLWPLGLAAGLAAGLLAADVLARR